MTEYYEGYPAKVREYQQSDGSTAFWICLPFVLAFGVTTWLIWNTLEGLFDYVLLATVGSLFLWLTWVMVGASRADESIAHVVPYFAKRLGDSECRSHGYAVASNCEKLDRLADRKGTRRLSAFGFNDDLRGESVTWHPANAGLESVTDLLDHLGKSYARNADADGLQEADGDDLQEVVADLRRFESALRSAVESEVRFCLVLLTGTGGSGKEHDVRQGSFY